MELKRQRNERIYLILDDVSKLPFGYISRFIFDKSDDGVERLK